MHESPHERAVVVRDRHFVPARLNRVGKIIMIVLAEAMLILLRSARQFRIAHVRRIREDPDIVAGFLEQRPVIAGRSRESMTATPTACTTSAPECSAIVTAQRTACRTRSASRRRACLS